MKNTIILKLISLALITTSILSMAACKKDGNETTTQPPTTTAVEESTIVAVTSASKPDEYVETTIASESTTKFISSEPATSAEAAFIRYMTSLTEENAADFYSICAYPTKTVYQSLNMSEYDAVDSEHDSFESEFGTNFALSVISTKQEDISQDEKDAYIRMRYENNSTDVKMLDAKRITCKTKITSDDKTQNVTFESVVVSENGEWKILSIKMK